MITMLAKQQCHGFVVIIAAAELIVGVALLTVNQLDSFSVLVRKDYAYY